MDPLSTPQPKALRCTDTHAYELEEGAVLPNLGKITKVQLYGFHS